MVVAPLVWAILTQHRDTLAVATQRGLRIKAATEARRARRPQYRPVTSPAEQDARRLFTRSHRIG